MGATVYGFYTKFNLYEEENLKFLPKIIQQLESCELCYRTALDLLSIAAHKLNTLSEEDKEKVEKALCVDEVAMEASLDESYGGNYFLSFDYEQKKFFVESHMNTKYEHYEKLILEYKYPELFEEFSIILENK